MQTLYLDLFSGVSGDMFVGALLDLGVSAAELEQALRALHVEGYHIHVSRGSKSGIAGTKFDVHLNEAGHGATHHHEHHSHAHEHHTHEHHAHEHHTHSGAHAHAHGHDSGHEHARTFADIERLLTNSTLSEWVKTKAIAVFRRIAEAEGRIHGMPPERVHFHEVGALDSIVDIVAACVGLELLGKPRVLASTVVEGTGWVQCDHGRFPVPAPATLAILGARGVPVSQCDEPSELVTPTGAALLAEFAEKFGPMRKLVARKIGFGLGTRDNKTRPNVLRAILSDDSMERETSDTARDWETDTIAVLETNLDDISSELLGNFVEKAFAAGALDVFHTPIQMKKNRPGTLLTVLSPEAEADRFAEMILRETTAFGVRKHSAERRKLKRRFETVQTRFGPVTVKIGTLDGKLVQAAPEFESCKEAAARANVPLKEVYSAVAQQLNTRT